MIRFAGWYQVLGLKSPNQPNLLPYQPSSRWMGVGSLNTLPGNQFLKNVQESNIF